MFLDMIVFVVSALTWVCWVAYFQGKNGEPLVGSNDPQKATPVFSVAPTIFGVLFFVAALVGAPFFVCAGLLGLSFGGLVWVFGDGANLSGATTRATMRTHLEYKAPKRSERTSVDLN